MQSVCGTSAEVARLLIAFPADVRMSRHGEAKLKVNFASPPTDSRVAVGSVSDSVTPDRPTRRAQRGRANFGSGRYLYAGHESHPPLAVGFGADP